MSFLARLFFLGVFMAACVWGMKHWSPQMFIAFVGIGAPLLLLLIASGLETDTGSDAREGVHSLPQEE